MKVYTIEIASAIEAELKKFLSEWGGGYPMRFTRFVDLGGKQTDLYVYTAEAGTPPWMIVRIKSVMKTEQGECIQYFVTIAGKEKGMEEVIVSPEIWKLPALADKVLNFSRNTMMEKIAEGGAALEGGEPSLGQGSDFGGSSSSSDDDEDYEDLDTSGILAGGGGGGDDDFDPSAMIAAANSEGGDDVDPSDLIRQMNEEADSDEEKE